MRLARLAALLCCLLPSPFDCVSVNAAQKTNETPRAPVPTQILDAKKVFIGNAGGEESRLFSGGPDRAYNQFYAAMKSWGRYELVATPADADLVFEIQVTFPYPVSQGARFRVAIRDPKTHAALWAFVAWAEPAGRQSNRDKNFDAALNRIVSSLQELAAAPAASGAPH